ncbi:MAG: glycogen synthase GlgA [Rhodospirillales bacterium]|nr:glycogen synthase GlgA [Rhodospirillales bacterium]
MRILFVASEAYPLAKTGGLADVCGALPIALNAFGHDARVLMPAYPETLAKATDVTELADLGRPLGISPARLLKARSPDGGLNLFLLDCPPLFDRAGGPYGDPTGKDWPDNPLRFGLLGQTAARLVLDDRLADWRADILHGHDWQAGLAFAYLHAWNMHRPATVFTIHNIAYQGMFDVGWVMRLELPWSLFSIEGIEYYGSLSFLKAGCHYADRLTTVSPTYAREIQSAPQGCGLEGLLAKRSADLTGILNGADYGVWNPATDPLLSQRFSAGEMKGKAKARTALEAELGLAPEPDQPILCVVSRLNAHKGMDLVLAALPDRLEKGARFVLLGTGDAEFEAGFRSLADRFPDRAKVTIGYSEALAHRILAGADILLMPSRAEPCGLTQMYAYRYGVVPVVGKVGGLADSVAETSEGERSGFLVDPVATLSLDAALDRALRLFADRPAWRALVKRNARLDFGWERAAHSYDALYSQLLRQRGRTP